MKPFAFTKPHASFKNKFLACVTANPFFFGEGGGGGYRITAQIRFCSAQLNSVIEDEWENNS